MCDLLYIVTDYVYLRYTPAPSGEELGHSLPAVAFERWQVIENYRILIIVEIVLLLIFILKEKFLIVLFYLEALFEYST